MPAAGLKRSPPSYSKKKAQGFTHFSRRRSGAGLHELAVRVRPHDRADPDPPPVREDVHGGADGEVAPGLRDGRRLVPEVARGLALRRARELVDLGVAEAVVGVQHAEHEREERRRRALRMRRGDHLGALEER